MTHTITKQKRRQRPRRLHLILSVLAFSPLICMALFPITAISGYVVTEYLNACRGVPPQITIPYEVEVTEPITPENVHRLEKLAEAVSMVEIAPRYRTLSVPDNRILVSHGSFSKPRTPWSWGAYTHCQSAWIWDVEDNSIATITKFSSGRNYWRYNGYAVFYHNARSEWETYTLDLRRIKIEDAGGFPGDDLIKPIKSNGQIQVEGTSVLDPGTNQVIRELDGISGRPSISADGHWIVFTVGNFREDAHWMERNGFVTIWGVPAE
jgi:hypothetical protein